YYWLATYSGDNNNNPITTAVGCGDPNERVHVGPVSPTLTTLANAPANVTVGSTVQISDTATLHNFSNLHSTSQVTFTFVGPVANPASPNCTSAPVVIGAFAVNVTTATGVATTGSQPFSPVLTGDYYWLATYNGDGNNNGIPTAVGCNDTAEL